MSETTLTTKLIGDPELHASVGQFDFYPANDIGEVGFSVPDRFGHSTYYNFSTADWARIKELINTSTDTVEVSKEQLDRVEAAVLTLAAAHGIPVNG